MKLIVFGVIWQTQSGIPNLFALNDAFNFAVDIISAIEFDKTGDHLATGDRGGRVVLFERTDRKEVCLLSGSLIFIESSPCRVCIFIFRCNKSDVFGCFYWYIVQDGGSRRDLERTDYPISRHPEFRYKTEFQSHEPEVEFFSQLYFLVAGFMLLLFILCMCSSVCSLIILRAWRLRRKLTRSDGAKQLMVPCFFYLLMIKLLSFGR